MTDNQILNIKDFIDRLIYLSAQVRATRNFAPIRVFGKEEEVKVNIDKYEDFQNVLAIYKIDDSEVEVSCDETATIYRVLFRGLNIVHVALKGEEAFKENEDDNE